jgi:hypothetical protein
MRIALIALSGIRVADAEILRLGLTLPGFVERSKTIAALPSLGLLTLAGMTAEELREGFHRLAARLYSDELTKWRRENFNSKFLRGARH